MNTSIVLDRVSVERLEQIEQERQETMADKAYQRWMQDLKVGSLYVDRILLLNAREAMRDWDSTRLNIKGIVVE